MCLSIPSKVVELKEDNIALVDTMGVQREVSLDLLPEEINLGDYLLIHIGFAINKIDEEDALASISVFREILDKMDENDRLEAING